MIAQFFYVGAQIMCWTFIIQYGTRVFTQTGMEEQAAEVLSQRYNIVAMAIFCVSRFICTFLMKYFSPGALLMTFAIAGSALTAGVIGFQNINGMYCLVGVSACMSLMFPTIYGIALEGLGDDAKFGAAGLIMAILGGSIMPPAQAAIIDQGMLFGLPAVNVSFILPLSVSWLSSCTATGAIRSTTAIEERQLRHSAPVPPYCRLPYEKFNYLRAGFALFRLPSSTEKSVCSPRNHEYTSRRYHVEKRI